jgi:hypothetical protein
MTHTKTGLDKVLAKTAGTEGEHVPSDSISHG